jgi:thiol:disulfide interchange protein
MAGVAKCSGNRFSWIRWIVIGVLVCGGLAAGLPVAGWGQTPTAGATPFVPKHLYSDKANPRADIAAALATAKREHKRVLLDFGGDWCGDCQVLDIYFHQPPNAQLLEKNFVLVHVWIGQMDKNIDIAAKYGVPIKRGVPALAVLSPEGKVIYSQGTGQFSDMRHMESKSVTQFLEKWKA